MVFLHAVMSAGVRKVCLGPKGGDMIFNAFSSQLLVKLRREGGQRLRRGGGQEHLALRLHAPPPTVRNTASQGWSIPKCDENLSRNNHITGI